MATTNRKDLESLLGKLGVEGAADLTTDRGMKKAGHRLGTKGIPADLTEGEKAIVTELGFDLGTGTKAAAAPAGDKDEPVLPVLGVTTKKGSPAAAKAKAAKGKPDVKAEAKAAAKSAAKGDKADKPAAKKKDGKSGLQLFADLMGTGKPVKKADVIEKLIAAGVKPGTASSYVVWAKRPVADSVKNPHGFRIKETKDDKKVKFLEKVTK